MSRLMKYSSTSVLIGAAALPISKSEIQVAKGSVDNYLLTLKNKVSLALDGTKLKIWE
jgi:hypothetical protein